MNIKNTILSILIIISISDNCMAVKKKQISNKSPKSIYVKGIQQIKEHSKNTKSIEIFKNLAISYPFSNYSLKGQIISAYIHYNNREYQDSHMTAQNYINNYPGGEYSLYALYLMALSSFNNAIINSTDMSMLSKAKLELEYLYNKDSNSKYIVDIKKRIKILNQLLSDRITEIGIFYFKRQKYQATVNRMKEILEQYPSSRNNLTALQCIIKSYENLNLNDKAIIYKDILNKKYSKHIK